MAKKLTSETPLMKQHKDIKAKYPDAILLFRVGDFYETFGEDAIVAARILGITLTKRANGVASHVELAGFPYHSLDTYLHKLVKAGYRVAVCDQLEDPKMAKGIVKRGVTEIVTPGVAVNDKLLSHNSNNYLAALFLNQEQGGVAFLDISTGEFFVGEGSLEYVEKLLQGFQPSELLLAKPQQKTCKELIGNGYYVFALDEWIFRDAYAKDLLLQHFQTHSLKGFSVDNLSLGIIAAGAILHYLKDTAHPNLGHITRIQALVRHDYLWLDRFTIRNLELLPTGEEGVKNLLSTLDDTHSPMGARLLKRWMLFPLYDLPAIQLRLQIVTAFIAEGDLRLALQKHLKAMGDMERLLSKIPLRKVSPREVAQLGKSVALCEEIRGLQQKSRSPQVQQLLAQIKDLQPIADYIASHLTDEAPVSLAKGNVIREGVSAELDELRGLAYNGKAYLLQLQQREAEATGISSLKVAFNNVFGYYLEVTHVHKEKVPASWVRKQTLTNAERYITPELKDYEDKILGAEQKIASLEQELFQGILSYLEPYIAPLQQNAHLIAQLDVLACFASTAIEHQYVRPDVGEGLLLDIAEGRHPVIERQLSAAGQYIPNSVQLNKEEQQIIILTGPNMSGKSALLRQTALITLMAHMGSFVPARAAQIPLTDKIFTRVGASDNLSEGESTFMVEMNETAGIINNVSERSLIILDEIGRGTSTYDGISIAWSIASYLHDHPARPKTLFATHYHELNELEQKYPRIKNYHITYKEVGNHVAFLRKLAPGGSRHSFGIQVARMAGMPPDLLAAAETILAMLEERNSTGESAGMKLSAMPKEKNFQLNIFDGLAEDLRQVQKILQTTDINTLTPVEALLKLSELKSIVKTYKD